MHGERLEELKGKLRSQGGKPHTELAVGSRDGREVALLRPSLLDLHEVGPGHGLQLHVNGFVFLALKIHRLIECAVKPRPSGLGI